MGTVVRVNVYLSIVRIRFSYASYVLWWNIFFISMQWWIEFIMVLIIFACTAVYSNMHVHNIIIVVCECG